MRWDENNPDKIKVSIDSPWEVLVFIVICFCVVASLFIFSVWRDYNGTERILTDTSTTESEGR